MARGDVTVFDEAKAYMIDGGWEATDDIKCAILDDTTTPAAADTTPALGDYTEVGAAGTYTAGGTSHGKRSGSRTLQCYHLPIYRHHAESVLF